MKRRSALATLAYAVCTLSAQADDAQQAFVEANILAIFYHELGHAVVDLMEVPIFGQEEDAADVMAVLLIDWLFEEETAQSIAYDSAFGYINSTEQIEETEWWGLHGPDEQRFFNHVCLFYGGNPENRAEFAEDLGLPEERALTCPDEYDLAAESWGSVFDKMDAQSPGVEMRFVAGTGVDADIVNSVLRAEIRSMSGEITLPEQVSVRVESCGEANAFYDPSDLSITFCTEFVPHLNDLFESSSEG
ncbi:DUF4344 domain-containing metallopeptidase [Roseobacter weihaiensis]|uniref:DUF4344 domain-containing metallopeptidase n=1 Tax=Roseobacter weihaiensis TaxID=2763262 RepID=UPI001D0B6557|nr:DUF4344 domain-containing metallopeptidase [Roseobacter sp. H9]